MSHLVRQLDREWDVSRRHGHLDRMNHYAYVAIDVSPPTMLLVRNALTAARLATAAGLRSEACPVVIDHRHGRGGVGPAIAAAASIRMQPGSALIKNSAVRERSMDG